MTDRELLKQALDALASISLSEYESTSSSSEKVRGNCRRAREAAEVIRAALAAPQQDAVSQSMLDVIAERRRQTEAEGWTTEHDDYHRDGSLALAAACYASNAAAWAAHGAPRLRERYTELSSSFRWPWAPEWWKPKSQRRDLVRAAALILAEIDRLDRVASLKATAE